ncbi:hypothetical protein [Flavobacterium chungangense]|nr:hypothetical protein [Flavobacterium chungangense]
MKLNLKLVVILTKTALEPLNQSILFGIKFVFIRENNPPNE